MRSARVFAGAIFLVSALTGSAYAQVVAERAPILGGARPVNSEYSIKPGDIISLYIIRMPELSRDYTVTTEGAIEVPFLGQINVLKKTSRDVATLVAASNSVKRQRSWVASQSKACSPARAQSRKDNSDFVVFLRLCAFAGDS